MGINPKIKFKETWPGVLRLDGELLETKDVPLVLVHPFFNYKDGKEPFYVLSDGSKGDYIKNLEKRLKSRDGNIIVFEEEEKLNFTADRISKLCGKKGKYFIPTGYKSPKPVSISLEDAIRFLEMFGDSFEFAGGYFIRSFDKKWNGGCLGIVYDEAKKEGLEVKPLDGCCFHSIGS